MLLNCSSGPGFLSLSLSLHLFRMHTKNQRLNSILVSFHVGRFSISLLFLWVFHIKMHTSSISLSFSVSCLICAICAPTAHHQHKILPCFMLVSIFYLIFSPIKCFVFIIVVVHLSVFHFRFSFKLITCL